MVLSKKQRQALAYERFTIKTKIQKLQKQVDVLNERINLLRSEYETIKPKYMGYFKNKQF